MAYRGEFVEEAELWAESPEEAAEMRKAARQGRRLAREDREGRMRRVLEESPDSIEMAFQAAYNAEARWLWEGK